MQSVLPAVEFLRHQARHLFTGQVLDRVIAGITGSGHEVELADLYREGFQPIMSEQELIDQFAGAGPPADILREQRRFECCDAFAMVFPVWWWSTPSILKGWIERVFTAGWAYPLEDDPHRSCLTPRKCLVVCCAGGSKEHHVSYGVAGNIPEYIELGILSYFGVTEAKTVVLHSARRVKEMTDRDRARRANYLTTAFEAGRDYFPPAPGTAEIHEQLITGID